MITQLILGGIIAVLFLLAVIAVLIGAAFAAAGLGRRLRCRHEARRIAAFVGSLTPEEAAEILAPRDGRRP